MRIIGGRHRGLRLASLGAGDAGAHLRPTPDRVRESLFNILAQHGLPEGAHVLDLFAGTGALGLEALSRGAAHVTFVESGRTGQRLIRENLAKARRAEDATLLTCDARRLPPCPGPAVALAFLDPPYGRGLGGPALTAALSCGWLAPGALIVWEEAGEQAPLTGTERLDHRRYGDTHVTILATAPGSC